MTDINDYISQVDGVSSGSSWVGVRWRRLVNPVNTIVGGGVFVLGATLMSLNGDAQNIGLFMMSLATFMLLPLVYLSTMVPFFLAHWLVSNQDTENNDICFNTLRHTAVAWCAVDPNMIAVFSHFTRIFEQASAKIQRKLIFLMLTWKKPDTFVELNLTDREAQQQFDALFPTVLMVDEEEHCCTVFKMARKFLKI